MGFWPCLVKGKNGTIRGTFYMTECVNFKCYRSEQEALSPI